MTHYICLAALLDLPDPGDGQAPKTMDVWKNSGTFEACIIIGAILVIVFALVIWAVFIRKPRPIKNGRESERGMLLDASQQPRTHKRSFLGLGKRQKIRRRRRTIRRNPTLAETGGLPPIRPEAAAEDTTP